MLLPVDYPKPFRGLIPGSKLYAHPDDYKIDGKPMKPELFLYRNDDLRTRLFLRTSIKLSEDADDESYTSATFLFDTGCCPHIMLSEYLQDLLAKRVKTDTFPGDYMKIKIGQNYHNCQVRSDLPDIHKPANVLGLPMFFSLGIKFKGAHINAFSLDADRIAHDVATFDHFEYF